MCKANAIYSSSGFKHLFAIVSILLISRSGTAQIFSELDESAALNPALTLRYSVNPRKPDTIILEIVRDSTELPLDRLRFLSVDWVQEELGIGQPEKDDLNKLLGVLDSFEKHDKWHYYAVAEEVAAKARAKAKNLQNQFKEFREEHPHIKWDRLDQIRLQFACLGVWPNPKIVSPVQVVRRKLDLSKSQCKTFASIAKEELGDLLSFDSCFSGVEEILDPSQQSLFRNYMKPFHGNSVNPAIALAHCRDMQKHESPDEQLDSVISDPIVLTMHGRFAVATQYLVDGSLVFVPRPWRRVLDSFRTGDVSWLELTEAQRGQLKALRIIRRRDDGISTVSYHGSHVFEALGPRPQQGCTAAEYHQWEDQCKRLTIEADSILGDAIKEVLLPVQLDSLKTALAISKIPHIGPMHVLQCMSEEMDITRNQQQKLQEFSQDRLQLLGMKFDTIDQRCRAELSAEQVDLLSRLLGPAVQGYPSVFLFF